MPALWERLGEDTVNIGTQRRKRALLWLFAQEISGVRVAETIEVLT